MRELVDKLNAASEAYYNSGYPIMTDQEFDSLLITLKALEIETGIVYADSPSINVGAPILSDIPKINITDKPMLSLDKVHSTKEIEDFSNGLAIIGMIKADGLSVRLIYENGELVSANTRGNGYIGSNITEHAKQLKNVPIKIPKAERTVIDGEVIIKTHDFNEINVNNEFMNPRNAAAGTLNSLETAEVARRRLSFIAWDSITSDKEFLSDTLDELAQLGFETVFYTFDRCNNEIVMETAKQRGIPCDGVVWKINDIKIGESMGKTSHHFLNGIAWKPEDECYDTTLIRIDWTMGRTGVLTPVAVFEPVEIDGSIVERANLHNLTIMENILGKPYFNQELKIYKANMIIPQVKEAIKLEDLAQNQTIRIPTACPICGGALSRITENSSTVLMCENPLCEGKLINQLDHFCGKKGLDIKGLSKATLEKLIDWGWVKSILDIFILWQYKIDWIQQPGFGVKSVNNILQAIEDSRNCELDKFICALGIPLVGATAAKDLAKTFHSWAEFYNAVSTNFNFTTLPNFGEETHYSIIKFNYNNANYLIDNYLNIINYEEQENKNTLENITVVITGKLQLNKNRDELKQKIENAGGRVTNVISANTNYLINNDINSTSAKNISAKKLNIPIITEEEFTSKFLDF